MKPFLLVLMGLAIATVCSGQSPSEKHLKENSMPDSSSPTPSKYTGSQEFGWSSENQSWKTEAWSTDDTPYRLIRVALAQKMSSRQLTEADLNQFQDDQSKSPTDPKLLFRWVYAATLLSVLEISSSKNSSEAKHRLPGYFDIAKVYHKYPLTHSYEFDRAHLIYNVETGADTDEFAQVVKRLYKHNPMDTPILHIYAVMLANSDQAEDNLLSTQLADRLLLLEPKVAMNHVLFGWCHYLEYWTTFNSADYAKASQGYHDFLKMSPSTDPFRSDAIVFLSRMEHAPASIVAIRLASIAKKKRISQAKPANLLKHHKDVRNSR